MCVEVSVFVSLFVSESVCVCPRVVVSRVCLCLSVCFMWW